MWDPLVTSDPAIVVILNWTESDQYPAYCELEERKYPNRHNSHQDSDQGSDQDI